LISLGGVVVNNGIILIDYVNQYRSWNPIKEGRTRGPPEADDRRRGIHPAPPDLHDHVDHHAGGCADGDRQRRGSELYAPLGQAIAGGLFTSTLITLFLIPTMYYITEERVLKKQEKKRHETT
jgi:HAE1 family hydrophobic/amphiphilic exporter-1